MANDDEGTRFDPSTNLEPPFGDPASALFPPRVALVGAGPGDPGLLTLRAVEWLRRADFVLYDRLVGETILDHVAESAKCVCVEELGPCHAERLPHVHRTMIEEARRGRCVVRLKGGDPMIFGRGGEEAEALREAGIAFEIVPGVTAALGVASCAAIPLTHRRHASAVAIVTGHEQPGKQGAMLDWSALARFPGTLVFYMGIARLSEVVRSLIQHGRSPTTPAAAVERGATARQRTITSPLEDLPRCVVEAKIEAPALIVVGDVVNLRERIAWFEHRPLFGKTVLVTRPRRQAGGMVRRIETLGGRAVTLPTVEIHELSDWSAVDDALSRLAEFDWLAFTSVNGVEAFLGRLRTTGRDLRALGGVKLAVIGPATAETLRAYHLEPDLVPPEFNSESLAAALRERVRGGRLLLARADRGIDLLREELSEVAVVEQVAVYSQRDVTGLAADRVLGEAIDFVSLTSSNVARALLKSVRTPVREAIESGRIKLVSISPRTSTAIRELGLPVAAEAAEYTTEGVLKAMCELARGINADPARHHRPDTEQWR